MDRQNILVPFGQESRDVRPLYHSFALAERVKAKIFVLFFRRKGVSANRVSPIENACREMIRSAIEAGRPVSLHIAEGKFKEELLDMIRTKRIGLVVTGSGDKQVEETVNGIKAAGSVRIVRVQGKTSGPPLNRN